MTTGATEDPDLAAPRELEEETGFRAGSWQQLTSFWSAPGFTSELMHVYLATDLFPAHPDERLGPDEDEHLRLERLPFADASRGRRAGADRATRSRRRAPLGRSDAAAAVMSPGGQSAGPSRASAPA